MRERLRKRKEGGKKSGGQKKLSTRKLQCGRKVRGSTKAVTQETRGDKKRKETS